MNMLKVGVGTLRQAKVEAVRDALRRVANVDAAWRGCEVIARAVETSAPAMPLSDEEMMLGARLRAEAVKEALLAEKPGDDVQLFVGLEGGFHAMQIDGERHTFLRGWTYVTDGRGRGAYGSGPSVIVPPAIVARVIEEGRELSVVIDEFAGERDVRSRQGAWGVLSRELLTRAMSFETSLIAAFAPFYNAATYARGERT